MLYTFPDNLNELKKALASKDRPRYRNRKYLDSFKNAHCIASDNKIDMCCEPAIPAHIRTGHEGSTGSKPDDCLTHPLCDRHHKEQHACIENGAEAWFIIERIYKPMIRRMFTLWYQENN